MFPYNQSHCESFIWNQIVPGMKWCTVWENRKSWTLQLPVFFDAYPANPLLKFVTEGWWCKTINHMFPLISGRGRAPSLWPFQLTKGETVVMSIWTIWTKTINCLSDARFPYTNILWLLRSPYRRLASIMAVGFSSVHHTQLSPSPALYSVHSPCVDLNPERSSKSESSFVNLSSCPVIY